MEERVPPEAVCHFHALVIVNRQQDSKSAMS